MWLGSGVSLAQDAVTIEGITQEQLPADAAAFDWLAGFDRPRLIRIGQWAAQAASGSATADPQQRDEAARLLFQIKRLARVQPDSLQPAAGTLAAAGDQASIGEWQPGTRVSIHGRATALSVATLPPPLADQLELRRLFLVTVTTADGRVVSVLSAAVPLEWLAGQPSDQPGQPGQVGQPLDEPTSLAGVVVAAASDLADSGGEGAIQAVVATADLAWHPTVDRLGDQPAAADWALLAERGFDLSQVAKIRQRARQPLLAADRDAFYPLLAIAGQLADGDWSGVEAVQPAELLQNPAPWVGRRLRMRCKVVRATRVMLQQPELESRLGSDHYWQIDALGDLAGVEVRLQSLDPEAAPALFAGQFPVSLVGLQLPDFLASEAGLDDDSAIVRSDVGKLARQVVVEGVFYRLWSYDSALMEQHGGGQQFGPLIMVSRIIDQEPVRDERGDRWLMAGSATIALLLMAAGFLWVFLTQRGDRRARERRRQRDADQRLVLPNGDTGGDAQGESGATGGPDADGESSQSPSDAP